MVSSNRVRRHFGFTLLAALATLGAGGLQAQSLTSLSLAETTIAGGMTTTATVTLDGPAPSGGLELSAASFDTNVAVAPATVTVPEGESSVEFTVTAQLVETDGQSEITVTLGEDTVGETLYVTRAIGGVSGTILDQKTGFPLPGASIYLTSNPGIATSTDLNGAFLLQGIPVGEHTFTAETYGYGTQTSGTVTVENAETTAAGALSLTPDTVTVTGNVFDPTVEENVEGVVVTAVYSGLSATTDANGNYTLEGVSAGLEHFVFHKTGYTAEVSGSWRLSPGDAPSVNAHLRPINAEAIHPTGVVTGVVKDAAGDPVAGVTVSIAGQPSLEATTAANGSYSMTVPLASAYIVTAQKTGYRFAASAPQPGGPGHFDTNWRILADFTLHAASATGSVEVTTIEPVSRANGSGVVELFVPGARYRVWTSASGTRTVSGVPAGPVLDCRQALVVPAGSAASSDCNGNAVVPEISPRWSAAGRVVSRATGLPIAGASVRFEGPSVDETVTTDATGRFSFSGFATGEYVVTASATGYEGGENLWETTFDENVEFGNYYEATFRLDKLSEWGTLAIDEPAESATLTEDLASVLATATLAIPGDYIVNAVVALSAGQVSAQSAAFTANGLGFTSTVTSASPNGAQTLTVEAATRFGARISATREITLNVPLSPREVVIDSPAETPGGTTINAVVRLNVAAGPAGATVALSSANPALAAVPSTLQFLENESEKSFTITTSLSATSQAVQISATLSSVTKSATLTVLPSTTGNISGRIVDEASGTGLADVNVALVSDPNIWVDVAYDGTFTLAGVPVGDQTFVTNRTAYETGTSSTIAVAAAQTTNAGDFTISPVEVTYTGTVTNPEASNAPIEGVTVTLPRSGLSTTTDASGVYTLVSPLPRSEIIVYSKTGFATEATELFLPNPGDLVQNGRELRPLGSSIPEGVVRGTVKDSAGDPVEGATVAIVGGSATSTAANGTYSITSPHGHKVITVEKTGYRKAVLLPLPSGGYFDTPWQTLANATLLTTNESGTLALTTYDAVTKEPKQGNLRLYAGDKRYGLKTSASGTRTVTSVPAGPIFGEPAERNLAPSQTLTLGIPDGGTAPSSSWSAAGRIFRRTTGLPVAGATVTFTNGGFTHGETTDSEGRYAYSSGPLGDYTVTVSATGGLTQESSWSFNAADDGGVRFADLWLVASTDPGSFAISSPAEDAVLSSEPTQLQIQATLPRPGDYIVNYAIGMSPGTLTEVTPTYGADGQTLTLALEGSFEDGGITFDVYLRTRFGYSLQLQRHVTLSTATVPASVTFSPSTVDYGQASTGTVTLTGEAGTGGVTVAFSSGNAAVSVPATVVVDEGQTSKTFQATATLPSPAVPTAVTITAAVGQASVNGTLNVDTPTGSLTGTVTSASGGGAISGATVTASPGGASTTTSGTGTFSLDLFGGSYTLSISKTGFDTLGTSSYTVVPRQSTSSGTHSMSPSPGTVTGTVFETGGVTPISGATVSMATSAGATTNGSGAFSLTAQAGTRNLVVSKAGYFPTTVADVVVTSSQTTNAGSIILVLGGTVTATITDPISGSGIGGATVLSDDGKSTTSASGGEVSLVVTPGTRTLTVSLSGRITKTISAVAVTGGATTALGTVPLHQSEIIGIAISSLGGGPVVGASVSTPGGATTTDATGAFRVGAAAGTPLLTIQATNYTTYTANITTTAGQVTDAGNRTLTARGTLTGTIVSSFDSQPVSGVTVTPPTGSTVTTNASGVFSVAVNAGNVTLTLSRSGYTNGSVGPTSVATGATVDTGTTSLVPVMGTATGTVKNSQTSAVLADATAVITGTPATGTTNGSGVFSVQAPPGTYTVTVSKSGYRTKVTNSFTLGTGTVNLGNVLLIPVGQVSGTVVLRGTSTPVEGATVTIVGSNPLRQVVTGATGQFTIEDVEAGSRQATIAKTGHVTETTSAFTVTSAGTTGLGTLTLQAGTGVSGTISQATTWTLAGSPYVVTGNLTATADLTIEPGVVVKVRSGVEVTGRVFAIGTATNRILFTSDATTPAPGDWRSLYQARELRFVDVEYGGGAGAPAMLRDPYVIDHVRLRSSSTAGAFTSSSLSTVFTNVDLAGNANGVLTGGSLPVNLVYWGSDTGPSGGGSGSGQSVSANANYQPWLTAAATDIHYFTSFSSRNKKLNPDVGLGAELTFATSLAGNHTVTITDSQANTVRTLTASGSTATVIWDAKDTGGTGVPNGDYFYTVTSTATTSEQAAPARGTVNVDRSVVFTLGSPTACEFFSPNGNGVSETCTMSVSHPVSTSTVTATIRDSGMTVVRTLTLTSVDPANATKSATWDGKDGSGTTVPDGSYTVSFGATNTAATASAGPITVVVDTVAPTASFTAPVLGSTYGNVSGTSVVPVNGTVTDTNLWSYLVYVQGPWSTNLVSGGAGQPAISYSWNTLTPNLYPDGTYTIKIDMSDRAGNSATYTYGTIQIGNFRIVPNGVRQLDIGGGSLGFTSYVPFSLTETLVIKDAAGQVVKTLFSGVRAQGSHVDTWDGKNDAGQRLPDGGYFYVATATDGASSVTIDLTAVPTGAIANIAQSVAITPGDPWAAAPTVMTYSLSQPARVWVVLSNQVHGSSQCAPPVYCAIQGDYQESGAHAFAWFGTDQDGVSRTDLIALYPYATIAGLPQNAIVVYGGRAKVENLHLAPIVYRPAQDGNASVTFDLTTLQNEPVDLTVSFRSQESQSVLRTISLNAQTTGAKTVAWDGRAGNGMQVVSGKYTVTVIATTPRGDARVLSAPMIVEY